MKYIKLEFFFSILIISNFAKDVPIDLYINDINVRPDSKPYISETNRTMVPISFVANEFKFDVKWNAKDKEVVITKNDGAKASGTFDAFTTATGSVTKVYGTFTDIPVK